MYKIWQHFMNDLADLRFNKTKRHTNANFKGKLTSLLVHFKF